MSTSTDHTHIRLSHGNGGRLMRELIQHCIAKHLANPFLDTQVDAANLPPIEGELLITTDSFTVQPLEFPGGDIGSLAVHGTINDLAVAGAEPLYLTLNVLVEEGLPLATLDRLMGSLGNAARSQNVVVLAGDTKVVRRGEGGGLYLAATGIGRKLPGFNLGMERIKCGDCILVSGTVGDHGTAVMLAREEFGLSGELLSDAASVFPLTRTLETISGVKFMRDPTRGGLATVCHEISQATALQISLDSQTIPLRRSVSAFCELLGYDPLYLACEGRVLAVVSADAATTVLETWKALDAGRDAAIIGKMGKPGQGVVLTTELGGERWLEELEDDPLPRIC